MAVPDYQSMMLPLLSALADGQEHSARDVRDRIAEHFALTPEDLAEMQPSGRISFFINRVHWARLYLDRAGVIETPKRGWYRLTQRGSDLLRAQPASFDSAFLMRYPEFVQFLARTSDSSSGAPGTDGSQTVLTQPPLSTSTPDEVLEAAYSSLRKALESELLSRVLAASPAFFEQLVIELLVRMGYGGSLRDAGRAIGRTGDGGIDGIIKEDRLGLDVIHVQAKRWQGTVGRPDIQQFAGSLDGVHARKGIFITTSSFSNEAKQYAQRLEKRIVLIDGAELASLMYEHGVGLSRSATYEVKRLDPDFFSED